MSYARAFTAGLAALAGCATAISSNEPPPDAAGGVDGGTADARSDAPGIPIDAPLPIDAPPPCTPMMTQLLVNPGFDVAPAGAGWVETRIDPTYPLVTPDDGNSGVVEHTPTMKVWLAGFEQAGATDQLYQDVAIPAATTALRLTGMYWTNSGDSTTQVFDRSTITLEYPIGTTVTTALALDNTLRHTAWQPLDVMIPATALAGQTVRLKFGSVSDGLLATSFWFDSFGLTAAHCQ